MLLPVFMEVAIMVSLLFRYQTIGSKTRSLPSVAKKYNRALPASSRQVNWDNGLDGLDKVQQDTSNTLKGVTSVMDDHIIRYVQPPAHKKERALRTTEKI